MKDQIGTKTKWGSKVKAERLNFYTIIYQNREGMVKGR